MSEILDILISGNVRNVRKNPPTAQYEVKRLSKELGKPVLYTVTGMDYDYVAQVSNGDDHDAEIVLECVKDPDLRNLELAYSLGVLEQGETWCAHGKTPVDLVKALHTPGEIRAISRVAQSLSGFGHATLSEVKKN